MIYLVLCSVMFLMHLLLKLNFFSTVILLLYFLISLQVHKRKLRQQKDEECRFFDVGMYIDSVLYSFLKEGKIDAALLEVRESLPDGTLKDTVKKAIGHMQMTFDETEVIRDSLQMIEKEYSCKRLSDIHNFMLHVEYYGGEIEKPINLLLEDKERWTSRIKVVMQERKKMFHDIVLSVIASLVICGMVLYLPVMNVDISENLLTQILTVAVILLDDWIILGAQSYLSVDYLLLDTLDSKTDYAKKMKDYQNYNKKKERKLSFLLALMTAIITLFCFVMRKNWLAVFGMFAFLICLNQHTIGHYLAGKNLRKNIQCAFPNWLMDLVLLLQSENVQVALQKSRAHVPAVLREELKNLVARLEMNPESVEPYHSFLKDFQIPEVSATMTMLYSFSVGNSKSVGKQMNELVERNHKMQELAETERLRNKNSGMYLLFLAPVLTASFKLVVDMAVFMLTFLSSSVV